MVTENFVAGGQAAAGGGAPAAAFTQVASALVGTGASSGTIYTLLAGKSYLAGVQISANSGANWIAGDEDLFTLFSASPDRVQNSKVKSPGGTLEGSVAVEIVALPGDAAFGNLGTITITDVYKGGDSATLTFNLDGTVTLAHVNSGPNNTNVIMALFEK